LSDQAGDQIGDQALASVSDSEPFELRLAQTIAWCAPRANPTDAARSLRTEKHRPWVLETDRATTVRHVLAARASTDPAVRSAIPVRSIEELGSGRLLLYFPDANLADGAAEVETGGFFDVDNVPPWDTWIGLFRDESADISFVEYLVSWVPAEFVELVERGIYANPEDCILWLADSHVALAGTLRSRGLLR